MGGIRWICLSDLHLGALNSLLTAVGPDGDSVDPVETSPVVVALGDALRTLCPGRDPPELIVLGDLFELALGTAADAAVSFGRFLTELGPGTNKAVIAPEIRIVPGNHDHHLWTRARGASYMDHISSLSFSEPLPYEAHTSRLSPGDDPYPIRDSLVELLALRASAGTKIRVDQSYPNLGIMGPAGQRAVVLSHGHFIEPLYRAMSILEDFRQIRTPTPVSIEDLEAENGAWIDFFWSSMGDSGDVGRWARKLYESLQSDDAVEAEVEAIRRAISQRPRSGLRGRIEGLLLDGGLTTAAKRSMRRERHQAELLSTGGREGLLSYLSGPVAGQLREERWQPHEVAFIFGHTHKPFIEVDETTGLPGPGIVINTGGWVVDAIEPEPHKGASVILIDEDLNIAVVRCFGHGTETGHQVAVQGPPDDPDNSLVKHVNDRISLSDNVWRRLAEATTATETERSAQLRARLEAQTDELKLPVEPSQRGETRPGLIQPDGR